MSRRAEYFDVVVVGLGGIGSAAIYWLTKTSVSVLGLEQFQLGHHRGGSQDHSRAIRKSYHDDKYSRLIQDAYDAWHQLERDSGLTVLHVTGELQIGRRGESEHIVDTYIASMKKNNVQFESLTGAEIMRRYPQFRFDSDCVGFYQKDGGLVDAALANACHIQLARGRGARIIDQCPVMRISRATNGQLKVHTTKGVFECRKVIVTAGAWLNTVLGTIGVHIPVTVTQEQVTYFATPHMKEFTKDRFPKWCYHGRSFDIYAMPIHGNTGTKVGVDAGGTVVTADTRTFEPDPVRERRCAQILEKICPKFGGPILETKTCLYTMPADRDFVIDTCAFKGWSDVIVCCGAGHAYKFAGLIGKILAEIAVLGKTSYDIEGFKITRDVLRDPTAKNKFQMGSETKAKL